MVKRTLRCAIFLAGPDPDGSWSVHAQAFSPDVAGGIKKRLPAIFRLAAATYYGPAVEFIFDEYIFEHTSTWPTDASQYDFMLITGADEGAYDQHVPYVPLIEAYIARNVHLTRFIGISYGHQVIAWGLNPAGGNVVRNPNGWENAAVEATLTEEGRSLLRTQKTGYYIHNHHGDAVLKAPPGTTQVSSSESTPVQSFISDRVFTNEGHMEYSSGIMNFYGLWDSMNGLYSIPSFLQFLNTRTFLPCSNRLNFLPDAIWLVGKMVGWLLDDGKCPSDAEMDAGKTENAGFARTVKRRLEKELVEIEYEKVVATYGGPDRVRRYKEALNRYIETGKFEKEKWIMESPTSRGMSGKEKLIRVAMFIPGNQETDWPPKFQVYSPDIAGGICKRLAALLRYAAALYFPTTRFLFSEYAFEDVANYPDANTVDLVILTGADDGAYDHHVPYIPEVERYVAENVNKTRFLGISFGHQIIAWGLNPGGGNVVKNPKGWENSAVESILTDEGRRTLKTEKKSYFIHNHHGDAVLSAPPGTVVVSTSSSATPVQSFISDRVFTNEGHLEYSAGIMENFGLWDTLSGAYTIEKYKEFLAQRTHLLCDNRLKFLPDAVWLAGKIVGWISNDGVVPSDAEMAERKEINQESAKLVLHTLEEELLVNEYGTQVKKYGGMERVKALKRAWETYLAGGGFDVDLWSSAPSLKKDEPKNVKVAIMLPTDLYDWPVEMQVFSPDIAGGIRKRLPALLRLAAARYYPSTTFTFTEMIFEKTDTWPKDASEYDLFLVTGAKEGAYDQHVPYVPILEKYIGDNVHKSRFIGISYGHQIIAWGLNPGGKNVIKNPKGWENAAVESILTDEGKRALNTKKKSYYIHNHHGDAVLSAPPGTVHVSYSGATPVQSFISDRVFTNEGHLEYSGGIMENFGLFDSFWGAYTTEKYQEYLASRTHLLCDNRLKFLPDAIWLAGKMVGWITNDGVVPSDEDLEERRERFRSEADEVQKSLEVELVDEEYAKAVQTYGGPGRVKALKQAWENYLNGSTFDMSKWSKVAAPAPKSTRTIKAAVLLPDPGGWPVAWQVFHPQVAGGIRKRLPTLFNIAAATYFPEFTFEFTEFIFENFNTWPTDASQYDLFLVTGAKEGAYDQHVPYVPVLEKYIGDNVNKTRFIGLSYGHQTIAWGLNPGGKNVIHNPHGWENAAVDVKVSREGMAALRTSKTSYFVNNHHGDAVLTAPPGTVHVSSSGPTPVQSFISDRVFTNEGHIEYSPGIMEMWARWDTYHGLYSLESAKHYLATRTHLPCDNKLGFLPDALWLAGKMVGWIGNSGVVPTDEELSARKAQYGDAARVLVEYYEDALLNRAYAEAVARYGGARRVAELKRLWDDYWSTGRKFSEEYFTEKN